MNKHAVIVVGGGLAGITTAYELASRGHPTTLLEAREGVALETSHSNGATLTPSMSDPWNATGVHRRLLLSLFDPHSAMKVRVSALPSLANWGMRFLSHASAARHAAATRASFKLAKYSVDCTRELRARLKLSYDASDRGSMKLFRDPRAMEVSRTVADQLVPLGLRFEALDRDATVTAEPALADVRSKIHGALFFPGDESGDAFMFCCALADSIERLGGRVMTGVRVRALCIEHGAIRGVETVDGTFQADKVVLAAGVGTPKIARDAHVKLPIQPVKGYTVTFPLAPENGPVIPVVDDELHALIVPLGSRLRVAGTAEFAGWDLRISPERIQNLLNLLRATFPAIAARLDMTSARPWAGLRPMSADGLPFIGAAPIRGLYVNAGHGHLGWTFAVGSARMLTDLIEGHEGEIDPKPYRVTR